MSAGSAVAAPGLTGSITVTPSTGLANGTTVTITGSGFTHSSIGNILECNSDANQPTAALGAPINSSISVSCNAPSLTKLVTTTATGTLPPNTTFNVIEGTVGPPCGPSPAAATCPAMDSAGTSPTAAAALYPCPPTAAQIAKGDYCTLTYGDQANDSGVAPILFGTETLPSATTTTAAPVTTTTKAAVTATTLAPATGAGSATTVPATVATTAAPSTLATTGPGRGVGWVSAIGGVLLLLGLLLLFALPNGPRRAVAGIFARDGFRKAEPPEGGRGNESRNRPAIEAGATLAARADRLGQRLGERVAGGSALARGVTQRVASGSIRTATWFLGR
jgi:hypothetical protein